MMEVELSSKADQIRWLGKYLYTLTLTSPFLSKNPGNICWVQPKSTFQMCSHMNSSLMFLLLQVCVCKVRDDIMLKKSLMNIH